MNRKIFEVWWRIVKVVKQLSATYDLPFPEELEVTAGNVWKRQHQRLVGLAEFLEALEAKSAGSETDVEDVSINTEPATNAPGSAPASTLDAIEAGSEIESHLIAAGLDTLTALNQASDEQLEAISGIGPATVSKIRQQLAQILGSNEVETV